MNKKIHFFNLRLWKEENRKKLNAGTLTIGELDIAYNNNRFFEIEDGKYIVIRNGYV